MISEAPLRLLVLALLATLSSVAGYHFTLGLTQRLAPEPASLRPAPLPRGIPRCKAVEKFSKKHRQTCITEASHG